MQRDAEAFQSLMPVTLCTVKLPGAKAVGSQPMQPISGEPLCSLHQNCSGAGPCPGSCTCFMRMGVSAQHHPLLRPRTGAPLWMVLPLGLHPARARRHGRRPFGAACGGWFGSGEGPSGSAVPDSTQELCARRLLLGPPNGHADPRVSLYARHPVRCAGGTRKGVVVVGVCRTGLSIEVGEILIEVGEFLLRLLIHRLPTQLPMPNPKTHTVPNRV
mmetsp:Transcript_71771/g.126396  ORF Transcript_71771/g.126396 Transcript_71771/m.126396 type:complete len:216 (+) Transcript_71771:386-1033(+)